MGFFSFQLARIDPQNIRSRTTDIDLLTFGVLVNGRDQGHGYAVIPVWPAVPIESGSFNEGAAINEYIFGATAAGAVAAFFADPVGTLLGYKPPGRCNGTVFSGKKTFTGATLAALPA